MKIIKTISICILLLVVGFITGYATAYFLPYWWSLPIAVSLTICFTYIILKLTKLVKI